MVGSLLLKEIESLELSSRIEGYYIEENPKSLLIRLPHGISFWVPKRFVDSKYSINNNIKQEFIIDSWILRKIGFRL
jgi:hypothetical protein